MELTYQRMENEARIKNYVESIENDMTPLLGWPIEI